MTLRMFTAKQQVDAIDAVIRDVSLGRRVSPTKIEIEILKSIRADLMARYPEEPGVALRELQRRLADAAASRGSGPSWGDGALRGIGQQVIGHWPTIRQALERFEAEITEKT